MAMPTFGEMIISVSKRLQDPNNTSVSTSDVGEAINDSIKYWRYTRFWFNAVADTTTLTAGSPIIPLPEDWLVEIHDNPFCVLYSTMRYPLRKVDPYQYDNAYLDNGQGIPFMYTNKAGVYQCYFNPDLDYTLSRYYLKNYPDLVNDSDSNDFTANADQLIMYWALSKLYAERRQDDKMEAYYTGRAQDELKNLGMFTAKKESPDHLTLNSYLL